ncbi:hypothetical protein BDF19DRAFT_309719 [Syncephalis fuscata]|nr:hypothetical protein BDF19DRAFT_309719 [Syncephalis fuscata]
MVGDDLTESVSMDKPGTGYFLSTLDCKSRGNIVYEVMTTVDVVNKVEKKRSDRYYLVVSWQVNPNKPVPSLEQKHEQEGDHRYKVAAMVLKAASPGFPARGFSQKQFFDTTGNFVLAGQVQEWTYPLPMTYRLISWPRLRDGMSICVNIQMV